ncbi:hypothetical protein [Arcticibacter tournemirensis]
MEEGHYEQLITKLLANKLERSCRSSITLKAAYSIVKEVSDNFPHLPLGCSIILEKRAKEIILSNTVAFRGGYFKRVSNSNHQLTLNEMSDLHLGSF